MALRGGYCKALGAQILGQFKDFLLGLGLWGVLKYVRVSGTLNPKPGILWASRVEGFSSLSLGSPQTFPLST